MQLICLTHPATAAQRAGAFPSDGEALDPAGTALLRDAALPADVAGIAVVLASPLPRAMQTAALLNLAPAPEPILRDVSAGRWSGCRLRDLDRRQLSAWLRDPAVAPPDGESDVDLARRVRPWLSQLPDRGADALVVTHAAVVRAVLSLAAGLDGAAVRRFDISPASLCRFSWRDAWRVQALNLPLARR